MDWKTDASGIGWYVGKPQQGKTTLALEHLAEIITIHKKPALVLDCGGAMQFRDKYHEAKTLDVIDTLWQYRENCYYTQEDIAEVDQICRAFRKAGNGILFVDEAIHTLNSKGACSEELLLLMRTRAHSNTHILLTTQNLSSDIPQTAFNCDPAVYLFAISPSALRAQETAEKLWDIPRARSTSIPQFQHIRADEIGPINPVQSKGAPPPPQSEGRAPRAVGEPQVHGSSVPTVQPSVSTAPPSAQHPA